MHPQYFGYAIVAAILAYLALPLTSWVLALGKAGLRGIVVTGRVADSDRLETTVPLLFLVPAHDEAKVIGPCVASILEQDYPAEMVTAVVVADNCHDDTATIARRRGADCLVRTDPDHPGKPQAIAWALQELGDLTRWEACVIVDADSVVARDFARQLNGHRPLQGRLVQAYYGILNPSKSWLTRLAAVLGRARYEVEYPLRRRAGLNCPLTGNGMSLGTELLARDGWQAFSLTENWEVYADYTAKGVEIDLANDARIYALETDSMSASRTRRSRWLRGRGQVLKAYWARIWRSEQIGWHQKLDTLADLSSLPPTVHASIAVILAIVFLAVVDDSVGPWFGSIALATLLPIASASAISLAKDPEPVKAATAFVMLPVYAFWRGWLLIETLLLEKGSVWQKTERR